MRGGPEIRKLWSYLDWPNRISLLRLLLVVPFVMLIQDQQRQDVFRYWALGIFVVMALSDFADGMLARLLHRQTYLGAVLDPLADKVLIVCSAVLLSMPESYVLGARLPSWVVVLIVGKDLWVVLGFALVFVITGRAKIQPTLPGKLCTAGQLLMVVAILLSPDLNRLRPELGTHVAAVLWWLVGGLCVLAVLAYVRLGILFLFEAEASKKPPGPGKPTG